MFLRFTLITLGCVYLSSAGSAPAGETDADDGLPRPEMGKAWVSKLLTPETTLDALHELGEIAGGFSESEKKEVSRFLRWCRQGGGDGKSSIRITGTREMFLDKALGVLPTR